MRTLLALAAALLLAGCGEEPVHRRAVMTYCISQCSGPDCIGRCAEATYRTFEKRREEAK